MASVHFSLPDQMKEWVQEKGNNGQYKDASDYVRDLIRKDQEREKKINALNKLIMEGADSGVSSLSADEILEIALSRHRENKNEKV